jgi:hypothetical protein
VVVSRTGRKVWRFRRRISQSAGTVELRLGTFPAHSIAAARQWGSKLNEAIERGVDPREEVRIEKAKAMSLADAHAIYMTAMRRGDRKTLKPRTIEDKEKIFARDIEPRLGKKTLGKLTEDECWEAVYDKAMSSKVRANKMAGELSCFLRWCSSREGQMDGIRLKAHQAPTLNSNWFDSGPKANKRFLSVDEIKWLFQALVAEELVYRRGILLLLLTAARKNELLHHAVARLDVGYRVSHGDHLAGQLVPGDLATQRLFGLAPMAQVGSADAGDAHTDFDEIVRRDDRLIGLFEAEDAVGSLDGGFHQLVFCTRGSIRRATTAARAERVRASRIVSATSSA